SSPPIRRWRSRSTSRAHRAIWRRVAQHAAGLTQNLDRIASAPVEGFSLAVPEKGELVGNNIPKPSRTFDKPGQGSWREISCDHPLLVHANRREQGQAAGVANIKQPIEVSMGTVHSMPRVIPRHITGLGQVAEGCEDTLPGFCH